MDRTKNTRRRGTTMIETICSVTIMIMFGVPLMGALQTTTRCVGVTRDYLVAQNVADMVYQYATHYAVADAQGDFHQLIPMLEIPEAPGRPVADLQSASGDFLVPDTGSPLARTLRTYTYTLAITEAAGDTVVEQGQGGTLYRVDICLYWKGSDGRARTYDSHNYLAVREF